MREAAARIFAESPIKEETNDHILSSSCGLHSAGRVRRV